MVPLDACLEPLGSPRIPSYLDPQTKQITKRTVGHFAQIIKGHIKYHG